MVVAVVESMMRCCSVPNITVQAPYIQSLVTCDTLITLSARSCQYSILQLLYSFDLQILELGAIAQNASLKAQFPLYESKLCLYMLGDASPNFLFVTFW